MCVTLPVDPHFKTESEAATLNFLTEKIGLPMPRVIAHASTEDDELGFEWILMQRMPGQVIEEQRKMMCWDTKVQLVKTIVKYIAELRQHASTDIGNVYLQGRPQEAIPEPEQDQPVVRV